MKMKLSITILLQYVTKSINKGKKIKIEIDDTQIQNE